MEDGGRQVFSNFRAVLEQLFRQILLQSNFKLEQNHYYVPKPIEDQLYYSPHVGLHSNDISGKNRTLGVILDVYIDGKSLCINVYVERLHHSLEPQEKIEQNQEHDALSLVQQQYLNHKRLSNTDSIHKDIWNQTSIARCFVPNPDSEMKSMASLKSPVKEALEDQSDSIAQAANDDNSLETGEIVWKTEKKEGKASKNESQSSNAENSDSRFLTATDSSSSQEQHPSPLLVLEKLDTIEYPTMNEIVEKSMIQKAYKISPTLKVLAQRIQDYGSDESNSNSNLQERILCSDQYKIATAINSRRISSPVHHLCQRQPNKQSNHYGYEKNPRFRVNKKRRIFDSSMMGMGMEEEMKQTTPEKDVEGIKACHDLQDVAMGNDRHDHHVSTISQIEMEWACVLLRQETRVPWRHHTDRWLAIGNTKCLEQTASMGERVIFSKRVLPALLSIRAWLNREQPPPQPPSQRSISRSPSPSPPPSSYNYGNHNSADGSILQIVNVSSSKSNNFFTTPVSSPMEPWLSLSRLNASPGSSPDPMMTDGTLLDHEHPRANLVENIEEDRRCLEQAMAFDPPSFLTSFGEDWIELRPEMLASWECAQLKPLVEPKKIDYLVLCPSTENQWMAELMESFIRNVSAMYQDCGLGDHLPLSFASSKLDFHSSAFALHENKINSSIKQEESSTVLLPSSSSALEEAGLDDVALMYKQGCQFLQSVLKDGPQAKSAFSEPSDAIVVYVMNPYTDDTPVNRCKLLAALASGLWSSDEDDSSVRSVAQSNIHPGVVFELLSMDQILFQAQGIAPSLREVCFSIFNKIVMEKRLILPASRKSTSSRRSTSYMYEPLYMLADPLKSDDVAQEGKDEKKDSAGGLLPDPEPQRLPVPKANTIHGSYGYSRDGQYVVTSWTDGRGQIFDAEVEKLEQRRGTELIFFETLWTKACELVRRIGDTEGQVIMTKLGPLSSDELMLWETTLRSKETLCPSNEGEHCKHNADFQITSFTVLSVSGNHSIQLLPNDDDNHDEKDRGVHVPRRLALDKSHHRSKSKSYGCISKSDQYRLLVEKEQDMRTERYTGYLIMSPASVLGPRPSALGGAVLEEITPKLRPEVTLEVVFGLHYSTAVQIHDAVMSKKKMRQVRVPDGC